MAIFYVPLIARKDYESFRRVMQAHIPSTYDEWLYLQSEQTKQLRVSGHTIWQIEIDPGEFTRFCDGLHRAYDGQMLDRLASEKGAAQTD